MSNRYNYKEPFNIRTELSGLSVETRNNPLLNIFRILSGSLDCEDSFHSKKIKFRNNYFTLPYSKVNRPSINKLKNNFPDEVDENHLHIYFRHVNSNIPFYKKLEKEIVKCLIAHKRNNILESFIHLYRILECISYSFPLIYISKSSEYLSSFDSLKAFMIETGNKGGELKFFETFLNIYHDEDFYSTTIDIDFLKIEDEELRVAYYSFIKNRLLKPDFINDSTAGEELKFNFKGFYKFLIEIRNKYFHLRQGDWQANINSVNIEYPELFFGLILDKGINWISIIIFEILKFDLENYHKRYSHISSS